METLKRKRKAYKALRWVFMIASIALAITPAIVVAFRVAPYIPKVRPIVGVASFASVIICIGILCIFGGLLRKYGKNLPWALGGLCVSWVLYFLIVAIKRVISQAEQVSMALAIGMSCAVVLSITSDVFAVLAKNCDEEFERNQ